MVPDAMSRLTRSLLFVPGSRPAMMAKGAASDADAVCLDLEDGVAPAEKAASRGACATHSAHVTDASPTNALNSSTVP